MSERPRASSRWVSFPALLGLVLALVASQPSASQPSPSEPSTDLATRADHHYRAGHELLRTGKATAAREARGQLEVALALYRQADRAAGVAESLYALALAAALDNTPDRAVELDQQAALAFHQLGDRRGEAAAWEHAGTLLASRGHLGEAKEHFEKALALRLAEGDSAGLVAVRHNLGALALEKGDFAVALGHFSAVLAEPPSEGDLAARAVTLNNLGLLWLHLERLTEGELALRQALDLHRELGDLRRQAGTASNLGLLALRRRQWAEARTLLDTAHELFTQTGDLAGRAEAAGNLALLALELGHLDAARVQLEAAIALAENGGWARLAASHRGTFARLLLQEGRQEEAERVALANSEIQTQLDDPWGASQSLFVLAMARRGQGNLAGALAANTLALAQIEALRRSRGPSTSLDLPLDLQVREAILLARRPLYDLQLELELAAGRPAAAVAIAERARARTLFDLLRLMLGGEAGLPSVDASAEASAEASRITPFCPSAPSPAAAEAGTVYLVFHLGAENAWVFRCDASGTQAFALGASAPLIDDTRAVVGRLATSHHHNQRGPTRLLLENLAQKLLDAPLRGVSPRQVVVVPDGVLHFLPFAALLGAQARPELSAISQVPALAVLADLRARPPAAPTSGELAVFADPVFTVDDPRLGPGRPPAPALDFLAPPTPEPLAAPRLPWTGLEAREIARPFPPTSTRLELGFAANREALLQGGLAGYRRLHFATHTFFDHQAPEASGLLLAQLEPNGRPRDGFVRLSEILQLELNAELVTLSACRTAAAQPATAAVDGAMAEGSGGQGLVGLSHGFLLAGARALVVSLWEVDDRATATLMGHFYRELARGRRPAGALLAAQRQLAADPRWQAPFYWAPFILVGDVS